MRLGPPPKRRLPHSEIDPPKEYSAPVGEIVLRWTRLEYQLGVIIRVIAKLGKADQRQLILNQRAQSLCRILRVLVPGIVSPDKIATELTEFAMEVEKKCDRRDTYVHSIYGHWLDEPAKPIRFRMKAGMLEQFSMTSARYPACSASVSDAALEVSESHQMSAQMSPWGGPSMRIFAMRRNASVPTGSTAFRNASEKSYFIMRPFHAP